jgi:hypothetical protein
VDVEEFKSLVPAQGFEPWTIGLKDRRSNQAELRRLNVIFPFSGTHWPAGAVESPRI